jgi:hypothetical protein
MMRKIGSIKYLEIQLWYREGGGIGFDYLSIEIVFGTDLELDVRNNRFETSILHPFSAIAPPLWTSLERKLQCGQLKAITMISFRLESLFDRSNKRGKKQ